VGWCWHHSEFNSFQTLIFCLLKIAVLSGKSKDMASGVKTGKAPLKKDVMTQNNPPDASDNRTGERHPERDQKKDAPQPRMQFDDAHRVEKAKRRSVVNQSETQKRVEFFRHLPPYTPSTLLSDLESKSFLLDAIHPSIYKVRIKYSAASVC
jgi:translation initiation factor eIF-2B subunit delta